MATAEEILAEQEANADEHIHMPSPSYWPMVVAFALPIMAYGVIYHTLLIVVGAAIAAARRCSPGRSSRRWPTTSDYDPPPPDGAVSTEVAVSG